MLSLPMTDYKNLYDDVDVTDVFKNAKPLGNFAAILFTYIASSILHVSAIQLLAVL